MPVKGRRAVSFRDLIEMRFVDAFLRAGVSWKTIRDVQDLARREFNLDHPFSTNRFRADGRKLVMSALNGDPHQAGLFDVSSRQQIFFDAAEPLREELELNEQDQVCRWWPLGRQRYVVLDPTRQWGRPLVARSGVPVASINRAHMAGMTASQIASWMDVHPEEITDALAFSGREAQNP